MTELGQAHDDPEAHLLSRLDAENPSGALPFVPHSPTSAAVSIEFQLAAPRMPRLP